MAEEIIEAARPQLERTTRYQVSGVAPLGTQDFFGPGQPTWPMGPPNQAGRILDYNVAENLRITPRQDERLSFWDLYELAENHDVTRLLIETRKDQMESLEFNIKPKGSTGKQGIDAEQQYRIDKLEDFFKYPDGENTFETWQRMILEECLVYDAPTIYINKKEAKNSTFFEVLSGAMIKRIIDENGRTPLPPNPAYQQVIKNGIPAWDYTSDELIYFPRNKRANKLYGFGPVQQIYITVQIALRRQASVLQYFTDGNLPDALIGVPETWTTQQLKDAQASFDALYSGNTAARRHGTFVPGGTKYWPTKEVVLKNDFDEWLARIACFAFSVSPTWLAKSSSRANAGTMQEASIMEGLLPLMRWFTQLMNRLIQIVLKQTDLEFKYVERQEADPDVRDKILDRKIRRGQIALNEARATEGSDPINGGDVPMIYMGAGPVPVKLASSQKVLPGALPPGGNPPPNGGGDKVPPPKPASGAKPTVGPAPKNRQSTGAPQKRPPAAGKPTPREVGKSSQGPFYR